MIYYWDKKLKKKRLHVLKADIITINNIELVFLAQKNAFLLDVGLSNKPLSY